MEHTLSATGAFARVLGLAPSALRYCDECGLLRPAATDETTGYSHRTPDVTRRANAAAQTRHADVSIEALWHVHRIR
jgi:DNA-binding transcriptional MerR regulator